MKQKPMTALRTARLVDAERIFALIHLHRDRLVPRSLGNIVENIDRFVVAEVDGEMVGCATYGIFPEIGEPLHTAVEIQSVAVRAPWRRQGVGRALVQEIVRRVRAFEPAAALVLTFYTGCINCTKYANPFTCPEKAMVLDLKAESNVHK